MLLKAQIRALAICVVLFLSASAAAQKKKDKKAEKDAEIDLFAEIEKAPKSHPLVGQIEAAMATGLFLEPAGVCAWDLYQVLITNVPSEPAIKPLGERLSKEMGTLGAELLNQYTQGMNRSYRGEDWALALKYIERAKQLQPKNKDLKLLDLFYQGMIALSNRQPDKAADLFRQGIKQDDKAAYFYNGLGRAFSDQKLDDEALKAYQKANQLSPRWTYPLVNIAIKRQRKGESELARQAVASALEIDNSDVEAHAILASLHASLGNYDEAVKEYQFVISQRPNSHPDHLALGKLFLAREDFAAAELVFASAVRLNPTDPRSRLYLSIATQSRARGLFKESLDRVKDAARLSPEDLQLQLALAAASAQDRNYNEAIEVYTRLLNVEPWHLNIRLELARLHAQTERFGEAIEEYRTILKANPNSKEAYNGIGTALKRSGKLTEAIAEYRKAIGLDETFVAARFNLAAALQENGEFESAASEFRSILTIDPANTSAASALKEAEGKLEQSRKSAN